MGRTRGLVRDGGIEDEVVGWHTQDSRSLRRTSKRKVRALLLLVLSPLALVERNMVTKQWQGLLLLRENYGALPQRV